MDQNIPVIPNVGERFSAKHVMNDADFDTLLKQDQAGLNRDAFLLALKPYRFNLKKISCLISFFQDGQKSERCAS